VIVTFHTLAIGSGSGGLPVPPMSVAITERSAGRLPPTDGRTAGAYAPSDQGVRLEQLNTLARLRDSGALTDDEFEAEKKRVLDGR
jgi:hypothetical protein